MGSFIPDLCYPVFGQINICLDLLNLPGKVELPCQNNLL